MSGKLSDNADMVIDVANKQDNDREARGGTRAAQALPNVTGLRTTGIRKTSISMPSKLDEMDVLRMDRQNVSRFHTRSTRERPMRFIMLRRIVCAIRR